MSGARLQRQRIAQRTEAAPVIAGSVIDLRGDNTDLDYYVFEMFRVREIARMISEAQTFPDRQVIVTALATFDNAVPDLKALRDPLTHLDGKPDSLQGVTWFDSVVRLEPGGAVTYMVDPRYDHHEALEALYEALTGYLGPLVESGP